MSIRNCSLLILVFFTATASAEPKAAAVFGDRMILQQGMAVPIWGTADLGEKVIVSFRGQEMQARVFSIVAAEWPAVKARLAETLGKL